jgi:hypothetical protein
LLDRPSQNRKKPVLKERVRRFLEASQLRGRPLEEHRREKGEVNGGSFPPLRTNRRSW